MNSPSLDLPDETHFRRERPLLWWSTLAGPPVVTALILAGLAWAKGAAYATKLATTAVVTFFVFGKFVILGGTDGDRELDSIQRFLTTEELFVLVVYMDLATACIVTFHLGFLFGLPFVGPRLNLLASDGRFIMQSNRWLRRATFIGLVAFVIFPLAATGSVGASILGRLLGMTRRATFAGIALGSVLGCAAMYLGGELLHRHLDRDNPWLVIGGIVVLAVVVWLLNHRYRRMKAEFEATREASEFEDA